MVAEVLAGIALVKSAVSGIKSVIDSANDVSDIAHHLDDIFKGHEQSKKKVNKKGNAAWGKFLGKRFKDEEDEISFSQITSEVIEQKQIAEQMKAVERLLNRRFGPNTWYEVLDLRDKRIKERNVAVKKSKEKAKIKQINDNKRWDTIWYWIKEFGKLSIIVGLAGLAIWWIIENRCTGAVC